MTNLLVIVVMPTRVPALLECLEPWFTSQAWWDNLCLPALRLISHTDQMVQQTAVQSVICGGIEVGHSLISRMMLCGPIFQSGPSRQKCLHKAKQTLHPTCKHMYTAHQKNNPLGKIWYLWNCCRFFLAKFTAFIEEDSSHICCEFHYKNWCDSIDTTV